ncbi:hypothetical protein PCANC_16000 [Puccinia coronata f. sp. avenae]|uniref:Uncharacterized protein n=1 Tax=Puccinia coronata f. sp. avenae TaxID=200324 RepID=A0A2N5VRV0_9BASI|nr:hypothetical protein PCANC_16000 [Puccinia coronata f. sp. avenae]
MKSQIKRRNLLTGTKDNTARIKALLREICTLVGILTCRASARPRTWASPDSNTTNYDKSEASIWSRCVCSRSPAASV